MGSNINFSTEPLSDHTNPPDNRLISKYLCDGWVRGRTPFPCDSHEIDERETQIKLNQSEAGRLP